MKILVPIVLIAGAVLGGCTTSSGTHDGAVSLIVDNDVFTGSDNNYTNGIGVSWSSNDVRTYSEDSVNRKWAKALSVLPGIDAEKLPTYVSWTLSQELNTPDDITIEDPPLDDQPYSGIAYVDSLVQSRAGRWNHIWGLRLGMVGPSARGEEVQREFHELIGADDPRGWDTQLPDEAIVNVSYTGAYLWKQGQLGSASWRVVPLGSVSVGNYITAASASLYAEVGWNLADAFAGSALRNGLNTSLTAGASPQSRPSFSAFVGGSAYAVAHYLPLDGTVFKKSRSVESEDTVGIISLGLSFRYKRLALSWSWSFLSDTFETQRESPEFGSLNIAFFH